jgi:crotonobetainyl-CoA:carnitine CoA-transferase CaiB-like acyl-CoA transferase
MVGELLGQGDFLINWCALPTRLSRTPRQVHSPMPSLGQHTETILLGLGYSAGVIQRLRQQGVVADVRWPSGN